jgi:hypothetical protein
VLQCDNLFTGYDWFFVLKLELHEVVVKVFVLAPVAYFLPFALFLPPFPQVLKTSDQLAESTKMLAMRYHILFFGMASGTSFPQMLQLVLGYVYYYSSVVWEIEYGLTRSLIVAWERRKGLRCFARGRSGRPISFFWSLLFWNSLLCLLYLNKIIISISTIIHQTIS